MPRSSSQRTKDWAKSGADMLENQRSSEMNRLIGKFQQYGEAGNIGKQSAFGDKIRGLGQSYGNPDLDLDSLLNSLYAKPGGEGYYDPSQYAWGAQATTPSPGTQQAIDVDMSSDLNTLANVPGVNEVSTAMPSWLQLSGDDSWKDIANAENIGQYVQDQRRQAGQDRAANVAAQQLESVQGLAEQDVMSDEDVARMLGGQAGQLADIEGRTMGAIRENMGARGMSPSSGIGQAMAGRAAIDRQMGLGRAGQDLQTQQMMANRQGLERALGLQSSAASNLENVLTGFGTTQWNMPAPDYWRTMQDPGWMGQQGGTNLGGVGDILAGAGGAAGGIANLLPVLGL